MVTPAAERDAVAHLQTAFGMSERRACRVLGCCRMTMRYQALRTDDVALRERMKAIAHERRRFGYRRLHVLLGARAIWSTTSGCSASIGKRS
jgi:putative transposase